MTCTDDELKRLKARVTCTLYDDEAWLLNDYEQIKALLVRLEAAEAVVEAAESGAVTVRLDFLIKAWRKAAGK